MYVQLALYVCHRATVSSLSPRKNRNSPSSSCSSPLYTSHLPPSSLVFDPPLQPRWKDDRVRKEKVERERGEKEMTTSQQVWSIRGEREREREREGEKEESATLMMSFSPWEGKETYSASGGNGAGLSIHTLAALFLPTYNEVNRLCLPSFWIADSLRCHLPG